MNKHIVHSLIAILIAIIWNVFFNNNIVLCAIYILTIFFLIKYSKRKWYYNIILFSIIYIILFFL